MTVLRLDAVTKRYRRGSRVVSALDGVSLELDEGDLFGVIGGGCSGKTTLLRIAAGLESPDSGCVCFLGRDLREMSRGERLRMLRSELGCVWRADGSLRRLTVTHHVALPLIAASVEQREAVARAHAALEDVGASGCADAQLPELSTSELVRVSIAQAVVRQPRLLLADQPTEALNVIDRDEVLAILQRFATDTGITVLMTAGDANGVMRANRLASLSAGRLLIPDSDSAEVVELRQRRDLRQQG